MNSKLALFILGILSILLVLRLISFYIMIPPISEDSKITFEAQVLNQPKISSRGQLVSLTLPNSQRVTTRLALRPLISYGDKIKLEGKLEYFEAQNGGKRAFMNYPKFIILERGIENNLIFKARENIISFFNSSLSPAQSSLMLGIVFGIKQEMPEGFYQNLQKTGLMHVIAASGMNVTMVGGFFASLFAFFLKRQLALILTIFVILFYAVLAGLEPSIVRASIMGILVFSAQIIGRQSISFLGLFAAAFMMLFINPTLLFDIGFQLSFMATAGLILLPSLILGPRVRYLIKRSLIGEDFVTTATAQIFTLPILLINFGSYSIFSVIVNTLLLWTVPIIMAIGGISAIFGLIMEPLGRTVAYISLPFLLYFEAIVNWFGTNTNQLSIENLPVSVAFGYYLILLAIIVRLYKIANRK